MCREGLKELKKLGCDVDPSYWRTLYYTLGEILQARGGSHLPEAEEIFRQTITTLSEVLNQRNLTSSFRISTFEKLKSSFNSMQSCLYAIYEQVQGHKTSLFYFVQFEARTYVVRTKGQSSNYKFWPVSQLAGFFPMLRSNRESIDILWPALALSY